MLQNINDHLEKKLRNSFSKNLSFVRYFDVLSIICPKERLIEVVHYLNSNLEFRFTMLIDIFAVDYPESLKRFEVNYCFLSVEKNYRVNIKVKISDEESIPSLSSLYKNAGWLEREVWDMHGVRFENNPDLRRILTDYGFEGHPLRKDFPMSGYKEVRYDINKEKVVYEPLNLVQEYRDFDFESPWRGTDVVLPGDEKATQEIIEKDGK